MSQTVTLAWALGDAVALGLAHEGRPGLDAEIVGHVVGAATTTYWLVARYGYRIPAQVRANQHHGL